MQVLERVIEQKVTEYAEALGVLQLKVNIIGRRGWPDRIYLYKGRVLFIEFKAPEEEPRKLQLYIHNILRANGFEVEVVDDEDEGKAAIDQLTRPISGA